MSKLDDIDAELKTDTPKEDDRGKHVIATMIIVAVLATAFIVCGMVTLYNLEPETIVVMTPKGPSTHLIKEAFYTHLEYLIKKGTSVAYAYLIIFTTIVFIGVATNIKLWRLKNEYAIAIVAAALILTLGLVWGSG